MLYNAINVKGSVGVEMNDRGDNSEWVLDPTLLLSAEEWNEVSTENPVKGPYVFAYILGDRKDNQKCATNFAKKMWAEAGNVLLHSIRKSAPNIFRRHPQLWRA